MNTEWFDFVESYGPLVYLEDIVQDVFSYAWGVIRCDKGHANRTRQLVHTKEEAQSD